MKLGNIKFSTCGLICGIILGITWSLGIAQEEEVRRNGDISSSGCEVTVACELIDVAIVVVPSPFFVVSHYFVLLMVLPFS